MVNYGVCVGSWAKLAANVIPRIGVRPLLALSGQTSIADTYNLILDAFAPTGLPVILLHDDLEIVDPDGEAKLVAALAEPDVMLAGVAGGGGHEHGLAWWNQDPVGHQQTDVMNIDFGRRVGDVTLLEGSLLAFSPAAVQRLRFDPGFAGFHGYDDIGMQAAQIGRVVVVDVDTHHHTAMGFKSDASRSQWLEADRRYRQKWGLR